MPFTLNQVVPWGRSLAEYRHMFSLTDGDLESRILGCSDGPASFNAEATARGCKVVSCDPLYVFGSDEIRAQIAETYPKMLEQTRQNQAEFIWRNFSSVEELAQVRMTAMRAFLADFDEGRSTGRYIAAGLPALPFANHAFDLALCSHFLFLYSAQFDHDFHIRSIVELCRVAREVRIFPLLELGSVPSRHLAHVLEVLRQCSFDAQVKSVNYEFQRGGNQMLRIKSSP